MEGIAERHVDMDLLIFGRKTVKPMKKDTARRWQYGGKSQRLRTLEPRPPRTGCSKCCLTEMNGEGCRGQFF